MTGFARLGVAPEKAVFRPALPMHSLPGLYGADMTKMTYSEQLAHPNWQRKRLGMLEKAGWKCAVCDGGDKQLHVHHKQYFKGRLAWEYEDSELEVLCLDCHKDEHDAEELLKQLLVLRSEWGGTMLRSAVAMLAGYMSASYAFAGLDDIREQCKAQFPALFDVGAAAFVVAISKRRDAATAISPLITIPMPEEVYEMLERWERCS